MAKYIKRIDAMKICRGYSQHCFETHDSNGQDIADRIEDDIVEIPTADVAEVKRGEWIDKFNRSRMATQSFCSVCGKHSGIGGIESNRHKPYCPNCGAKMDGGKAE